MITGDKLLDLLDKFDKTDRDLIGYVCQGLQAHDEYGHKIEPLPLKIALWKIIVQRRFDELARSIENDQAKRVEDKLREIQHDQPLIDIDAYHVPDLERYFREIHPVNNPYKHIEKDILSSVYHDIIVIEDWLSKGGKLVVDDLLHIFPPKEMGELARGLTKCYYEHADVERFIDADAGAHDTAPREEPPVHSESKDTEELTQAQAEDWPVAEREDSGRVQEGEELVGWEQIAGALRCSTKTAQRLKKRNQGMPVTYNKSGSPIAYSITLKAWYDTPKKIKKVLA